MLVVRLRAFVDTTSSLPAFPAARSHARMARPIVTGTSLPDRGLLAFFVCVLAFLVARVDDAVDLVSLAFSFLLCSVCCAGTSRAAPFLVFCHRHWVLDPPMPSSE